jgi:threonine dehydrogenase-like Zn-dependent dehydrogenase
MHTAKLTGKSVVEVVEASDPIPGPGEVLIETAISALCGSELHSYFGEGIPQGNNGHEAAGIVVRLGQGVSNLQVGQRVGVSTISGCGKCAYCARGQYTFCSNWKFYGNMHAERFLASAIACHPLTEDIGWEAGVLLSGDGLGVPFHTSRKIAAPEIQTVAIFGVGPIGLGNVLLQSYLGRRVIAIDLFPARLAIAKHLGAWEVINAQEIEPAARVRELTDGAGADACIEAAGKPETALGCFAAVRKAGTVIFNGEQGAVPLSPSDHFIRRDITAIGSWYYHFSEFGQMLELYRSGLRLTDLITHRYPFAQADAAYKMFTSGQSGKVLLDFR